METEQPRFVRTNTGRILPQDSPEAQRLLASIPPEAGPTATFGIVEFVKEWTSPDGREYHIGDFEKFATNDAASAAQLSQLTSQGTVRVV